ncbi:dihydrofolate reductase [Parahaliea mediterranea]|uniref:dihydrofolate reductase n=1 Tax=Parahaliea mediterranea TaxID=651086 RepID=UPI000E2FAD96|nr:dihydrofolate reductase [Parahaliea mediterranea]
MALGVIVAVAENGVVGRDNTLPWHLPGDLAWFKRNTLGKPVIMGRRTWESIGRPLPGRLNIVVSRNPAYRAEGATVVDSLPVALALGRAQAATDGACEVMVIGGPGLYAEALPLADRFYVTEVHAVVAGDAVLPPVDWRAWREVSREPQKAADANGYDYSFVVFEREQANSR